MRICARPKVRAFMNFMGEALAPHRDLIEGRLPPQFTPGDEVRMSSGYMESYLKMHHDEDVPEDQVMDADAPSPAAKKKSGTKAKKSKAA